MKRTSKKEQKSAVRRAIEADIAKGWKMRKTLVEAHVGGGLFSTWNPATYDHRTVYKLEDLWKLTREGFILNEDVGAKALNLLLKL